MDGKTTGTNKMNLMEAPPTLEQADEILAGVMVGQAGLVTA